MEQRRYKKDYAKEVTHMMSVREELELKGELRSARHILTSQLTAKFGSLGGADKARVNTASKEQLEQWALAVLTANTPDEVFALQ